MFMISVLCGLGAIGYFAGPVWLCAALLLLVVMS